MNRRSFLSAVAHAVTATVVVTACGTSVSAQSLVDAAIAFYERGGAYCVRVVPFGVSLSEETEWTVLLLTSAANRRQTFRIRTVDPGASGLEGAAGREAGRIVTEVWRADRTREAFIERFAQGIRRGSLRARVVNAAPARLAQTASDRERADLYLRFADRGSKISFDGVPDLAAEDLQRYSDYFPD